MSGAVELLIQDEALWLLPERAVFWPRGGALIVADTHFGKSGALAHHGLAIPGGTDDADRRRLTTLIADVGAQRIIVLGDFLHEPLQPQSSEAMRMQTWCESLGSTKILVIAGNHDRGVSSGWRGPIEWIAGAHWERPFRFIHDDSMEPMADPRFSMSGHIHPAAALRGLRKRSSRVPAFWLRKRGLVLPSFGSFTGGYLVQPGSGEQLFAVSPERVVPFPLRP